MHGHSSRTNATSWRQLLGLKPRTPLSLVLAGAAIVVMALLAPAAVYNERWRTRVPSRQMAIDAVNESRAEFLRMAAVLKEEANKPDALARARRNLDVPMYYVNLDRSPARRARMQATLEALGDSVTATRVPAVDAYTLNMTGLRGKRTPTEVACLRSHVLALQMLLDDGHNMGLILEDDVSFDAAHLWPKPLSQIAAEAGRPWPDKPWTALQLYSNKVLYTALGAGAYGNTAQAVDGHVWGAVGFIVTREWAKVVVEASPTFEAYYTSEEGVFDFKGAHTLHVEPSLVWPANGELELTSTIHVEHDVMHLWRGCQAERVWYDKLIRLNSSVLQFWRWVW